MSATEPGVYAHLNKLSTDYNNAAKEEVRRQTHIASWWMGEAETKNEEINALRKKVQDSKLLLQLASEQSEACREETSRLVDENQGLRGRLEAAQEEGGALRAREKGHETRIQELAKSTGTLSKCIAGKDTELLDAKAIMDVLREEKTDLSEQVHGADSNCEWFRDELTRSTEAAGRLTQEHADAIGVLKQEADQLKADHAVAVREVN
ncbi:hypothetical protein LTR36_010483 [Oleoguttula mirabilis]|uniref:Myosin heavy chain n=1 Tax=Oleoguttula mirabilis TaxID=1507867 RepID=A0AAV9J4U0_9PEZI|nr:hypothetical protein LTR36_010483 [Oleoguttula mirabilis]